MEAKLEQIADDLSFLKQMRTRYDNPELKFIVDWLLLYLDIEIEEIYC